MNAQLSLSHFRPMANTCLATTTSGRCGLCDFGIRPAERKFASGACRRRTGATTDRRRFLLRSRRTATERSRKPAFGRRPPASLSLRSRERRPGSGQLAFRTAVERLVTGSGDRKARIWDLTSGKRMGEFKRRLRRCSVCRPIVGRQTPLLTGNEVTRPFGDEQPSADHSRHKSSGTLVGLAQRRGNPQFRSGTSRGANAVAFSPDSAQDVLIGDLDGTLQLCDSKDGTKIRKFNGHENAHPRSVEFLARWRHRQALNRQHRLHRAALDRGRWERTPPIRHGRAAGVIRGAHARRKAGAD